MRAVELKAYTPKELLSAYEDRVEDVAFLDRSMGKTPSKRMQALYSMMCRHKKLIEIELLKRLEGAESK